MIPEARRPLQMASTGCSCCASPVTEDRAVAEATPASTAETTSYPVPGMTCGHCAGSVTTAISAVEGVEDVRVDLVPGGVSTVTVVGASSPAAVRAAITEAGYNVANT